MTDRDRSEYDPTYVPPLIARMKRQHAEALAGVEAERDELLAANKLLQTKLDLLGGFGSAADNAALRVVRRRDASIERLTARIRQLRDERRAAEAERDADARAVARVLDLYGNAPYRGVDELELIGACVDLQARFANRIAALNASDATAGS
jgi:hypothetical protein